MTRRGDAAPPDGVPGTIEPAPPTGDLPGPLLDPGPPISPTAPSLGLGLAVGVSVGVAGTGVGAGVGAGVGVAGGVGFGVGLGVGFGVGVGLGVGVAVGFGVGVGGAATMIRAGDTRVLGRTTEVVCELVAAVPVGTPAAGCWSPVNAYIQVPGVRGIGYVKVTPVPSAGSLAAGSPPIGVMR